MLKLVNILTNLLLVLVGSIIAILLMCILYLKLDSHYNIAHADYQIYTDGSRFKANCVANFGESKRQRHECV
jgi:hypothetical protein